MKEKSDITLTKPGRQKVTMSTSSTIEEMKEREAILSGISDGALRLTENLRLLEEALDLSIAFRININIAPERGS